MAPYAHAAPAIPAVAAVDAYYNAIVTAFGHKAGIKAQLEKSVPAQFGCPVGRGESKHCPAKDDATMLELAAGRLTADSEVLN